MTFSRVLLRVVYAYILGARANIKPYRISEDFLGGDLCHLLVVHSADDGLRLNEPLLAHASDHRSKPPTVGLLGFVLVLCQDRQKALSPFLREQKMGTCCMDSSLE